MKNFAVLLAGFVALPSVAFASGGGGETDIVARVINFAIFAGILYYLLAKPAKAFYCGRIEKIDSALKASELKAAQSAERVNAARAALEAAKTGVAQVAEVAKKDAEIIAKRIEQDGADEAQKLRASFENKKELETKKARAASVALVLGELFDSELKGNQQELFGVISKKIS